MHKKFLFLIIAAILLKELVWLAIVPLWHFPDEQSHFAQVAFISEIGRQPKKELNDRTEEIRISEYLLGTERDTAGNNRFTFHPDYKIDYSKSLTGINEVEIKNISKELQYRRMNGREASRYPPLYYFFLAIYYNIFYNSDLLLRVFLARIIQLVFYIGTVIIVYLIGKLFFRNFKLSVTLALLVAFHPMYSFVSAGINSDNLGNFIFTLFVYLSLVFIKSKLSIKKIIGVILVSIIAIFIKPQFSITLPLVLMLVIYKLSKSQLSLKKKTKILILFFILILIFTLIISKLHLGPGISITQFLSTLDPNTLFNHFIKYAFPHIYREVMPWYWGVFDWLGVTYPRIIHRCINSIVLVSAFGFIVYLRKNCKKANLWPVNGILLMILINFIFVMGVYYFDLNQFIASGNNFHLGVQGRYFFPLIVTHMIFLLIGVYQLANIIFKYYQVFVEILFLLFFIFHGIALFTVIKTYYDFSSVHNFIIQTSQYKPWFFKGDYLVTLIITAITTNAVFLVKYFYSINNYVKADKSKN